MCKKKRAPGTPSNAALDRTFLGAVRVRVIGVHPAQLPEDLPLQAIMALAEGRDADVPPEVLGRLDALQPSEEVLSTVTDLGDVAELRACLAIGQSGFHCMCMGGPIVEVSGPEGVRARITLHHGQSIRWDGVWDSDAALLDGPRLLQWLGDHGVPGPQLEAEAAEEAERQAVEALERWRRAMPPCLAPLWAALSGQAGPFAGMVAFGPGDPSRGADPLVARALQLVGAAHPRRADAVLALLGWLGAGAGPWDGFPAYEGIVEEMLARVPAESIVAATATLASTSGQLVGAARTLTRRGGVLPHALRDRLRQVILDPENLAMFDAAFADRPTGRARELRRASARAAAQAKRAEEVLRRLAPVCEEAHGGGNGAFGRRGRRSVSVWIEDDERLWVIRFEDGENVGDRRLGTIEAAVSEAVGWLKGQ